MKKRTQKITAHILLFLLLTAVLPAEISYAAVPSVVNPPELASEFQSTENFDLEYLHGSVLETDDRILKLDYCTPLQTSLFRLSLYRIGDNSGDLNLNLFLPADIQLTEDGMELYHFTGYLNMQELNLPNGRYAVYIRRCATEQDTETLQYTNSGVLNKNMIIQVTEGQVSILRYQHVIDYNREIMAIGNSYAPEKFLDTALEDIRFVLRNPVTRVYSTLTSSKVNYIDSVSDRICEGTESDYEKLRKLYEYTASNFYYDTIAFQTHSNQFANPYDNILNFENGRSSANSQKGRVYTTCQGYSAILIALARAQGIPARLVYGHRAAVPSNDWLTESNINVRDHWWVEAWVDGRWIFIDPTVGTTNKYNSNTGKWTTTGLTNYTYFDPTEEQIATSHLYFNYYPEYRYGYYIENSHETDFLKRFLNTGSKLYKDDAAYESGSYYSYRTNGLLLSSDYVSYDKKTWGNGKLKHFMTDGNGNVSQIQWSNYGFSGALNLPDFKHMKLLSSHGNRYETVNLSGCTALEKIYLYNNEITSMDLSDCTSAWYVRCRYNPMKALTVYTNGQNRTFTAGEHGSFSFTIDTSNPGTEFSLYSKPDTGYKVSGIYSTQTGKRLSSKKTWHFTPNAAGYEIRFEPNPKSYKYTISPGDSAKTDAAKGKYIAAAAKRLEELGYYQPYAFDSSQTYSFSMQQSAIKFQVMHDLDCTGILNQETWAALFSTDAKEMVNSYEYMQIQKAYEERKAEEVRIGEIMKQFSIQAKSSVLQGSIKIDWTAIRPSLEDKMQQDIKIDGYEVWKSSDPDNGFVLMRESSGNWYRNTSGLKSGQQYYYKVRAFHLCGEKRMYSDWSNLICQTAL